EQGESGAVNQVHHGDHLACIRPDRRKQQRQQDRAEADCERGGMFHFRKSIVTEVARTSGGSADAKRRPAPCTGKPLVPSYRRTRLRSSEKFRLLFRLSRSRSARGLRAVSGTGPNSGE